MYEAAPSQDTESLLQTPPPISVVAFLGRMGFGIFAGASPHMNTVCKATGRGIWIACLQNFQKRSGKV